MNDLGKWKESNENFINPYNFIEVGDGCKKGINSINHRKTKNLMTGVINCSLYTKTPIFIPNTLNSNAANLKVQDHKSYDFFSYEDVNKEKTKNPIIPGSSIKGIIRSTYEMLTDSCFSVIDDERILYKRMPFIGMPGLLKKENGKLVLYKTKKYTLRYKKNSPKEQILCDKLSNCKECSQVWIKTKTKKYTDKNGNLKQRIVIDDISLEDSYSNNDSYKLCYLIKGEDNYNKKSYSFFQDKLSDIEADLDQEECELQLDRILDLYDNKKINTEILKEKHKGFKDYRCSFDEFKKSNSDAFPVYYKKIGNKYYLSPSQITKQVYKSNIHDILNYMGNYNPCDNNEDLCEACELFGMTGRNNSATSSKIRFTDAKYYGENINDILGSFITLSELASPKISATEFYLN